MKLITKFLLLAISINILSCNSGPKITIDYKYANPENTLKCGDDKANLFTEALLSFENDLAKYYGSNNSNLSRAYSLFYRNSSTNRIKFEEIVSPHSMKIFNALKLEKNLWKQDHTLNFNHPIFNCIGNHIANQGLKTTFNALTSTNSMNSELFAAPLSTKTSQLNSDKHLALYVALDYYYAKLFNVDETKITDNQEISSEAKRLQELKNKKIEAPIIKNEQKQDSHAGHNH